MPSAATGISDVPTEILGKILDSLHDDPAALYSASLVGRDWVSAPRYHMFHRTIIQEFECSFRGITMVNENVESFLSLSQSRYCTILPAMRYVVLSITSHLWLIEVIKVLSRAKALSRVVFFQIDESSPPPSWMARMLPDIHDFTYDTWSTFGDGCWRLLASFPHLRTLAVHINSDIIITFPRDISRSSFCNIVNIQLRLTQSEELFDWMNNLAGFPLTRVETLDLRIHRSSHKGWGSVIALNSFLKANAETMKHLSVGIKYTGSSIVSEDLSNDDIDLSPLINLRSLFLQTHDLDSVCSSIASIRSCLVESLTVYTFHWRPDECHFDNQLECHCDFYDLFTKLAKIMEEKTCISGTTMSRLQATKQPRIDGLYWNFGYVSLRWTNSGVLAFSEELLYDYDKQYPTYTSLRHLLWQYVNNKSAQPTFLR